MECAGARCPKRRNAAKDQGDRKEENWKDLEGAATSEQIKLEAVMEEKKG